jgi:hypothetical protein
MNKKELQNLFSKTLDIEGDELHAILFSHFVRKRKAALDGEDHIIEKICTEEYDELTKRLDLAEIQASCNVRNVLFTRRLANVLINDEAELDLRAVDAAIGILEKKLYSTGPQRQFDARRYEHVLKMLKRIKDEKELRDLIKKLDKPYSNPHADKFIRDALQMPSKSSITEAHAKRAVLSALLCYLRQSVGSCFATAPAIIVHDEQPAQFLRDMAELLGTGRLKRTFGGEEYSAPLSFSSGAGDLRRKIFISKDLSEGVQIWQSPGLINALEVAGVLSRDEPLPKRRAMLKKLIAEALSSGSFVGERLYLSVEDLLHELLLRHHGISQDDLDEYLHRPHEMVHGGLMMRMSKTGMGKGGVGQRAAGFLQDKDAAGRAFTSLADNALLKGWEFTLATFTETKAEFSKWNLYISLGLRSDDKGGIGQRLYEILKDKLERENRKVEELQSQYEQVYAQLKFLESRMRRASEDEARWLRSEYQSRRNEFSTIEDIRGEAHRRAESFANLFDVLIDRYLKLFPRYFQEVYDADMHHVTAGPYDDSPAGFQLIYKYGRAATSAWTPVKNLSDFVEVLNSFFTSTEYEIVNDPLFEGFGSDISEITTAIVNHIKTDEFLESALYRMAAAKNAPIPESPLENLDKVEKKPWAYTSGGSLDTLLSCYFSREERPTHIDRWMENQTELLVYLLDGLKETPPKITDQFVEKPEKNLLITSPTHAFNLKPGYKKFRQGWESKEYTYIWCRDQVISKMKTFVERMKFDDAKVDFLFGRMIDKIPKHFHHFFRKAFSMPPKSMNPILFREYVVKTISRDKNLTPVERYFFTPDEVDSLLYKLLPLFKVADLKERVGEIFGFIDEVDEGMHKNIMENYDDLKDQLTYGAIVSAEGLRNFSLALIAATLEDTFDSRNWHKLISRAMQELKFAMPEPIIFADTNWAFDMFGFVVNPGTGEFELWRLDDTGTAGSPMSIWRKWLDGSRRKPPWSLYTKPHEYQS